MKKSEFLEKVKALFDVGSSRYFEVEAENEEDGTLRINVTSEYEYVDITFEQLEKITELCGSKKLNIGEKDGWGGCDTCDYGSRYTVPLYVKDAKPFD